MFDDLGVYTDVQGTDKKVAFKTLKKKSLAERPARISPTIEVECHARAGTSDLLRRRVARLEAVYEDSKNLYMVFSSSLSTPWTL